MPALPPAQNSERVDIRVEDFEGPPRTSAPARLKQPEGQHLPSMLHAPGCPPTENNGRVVIRLEISKMLHAPALKQREGRRSGREYRGRFTRQRHDKPAPPRGVIRAAKLEDAQRASDTTAPKQREGRRSGRKFRGCSTRHRRDKPDRPPRGSSFAPRNSKTLHAPATRWPQSTEKVVVCTENFEDAPRARSTTSGRGSPRGSLFTPRISRTLREE